MPKSATKQSEKPARSKSTPSAPREVKYSEVAVNICTGDAALNQQEIRDLLGWKESGDGQGHFTDMFGNAVWCMNNLHNRPIDIGWCKTLAQEHLNRRWRFNGETIVVGEYGDVLSAQHRLISAVFAEQVRLGAKGLSGGDQSAHWKAAGWASEVTMECLVVKGVKEDSETTRTLDNVKPRTLADVLFCDPEMFPKCKPAERDKLTKLVDYAVKQLWFRTGADKDPFAPRRTHSEALDFLSRHPSLIGGKGSAGRNAAKHLFEENAEGSISPKYLGLGHATALLYLMATGNTDGDDYRNADPPRESKCDIKLWDKACEFWVLLGAGAPALDAVRKARCWRPGDTTRPTGVVFGKGEGTGSRDERAAIIIKAWRAFREGGPVSAADVRLEYALERDDNGAVTSAVLAKSGYPDLGGIDLGHPAAQEARDSNDEAVEAVPEVEDAEEDIEEKVEAESEGDPAPEEIAEHANGIRNGNGSVAEETPEQERARRAAAAPPKPRRKPTPRPRPADVKVPLPGEDASLLGGARGEETGSD